MVKTFVITIVVVAAIFAYLYESGQEATETQEPEGNKYVIPFIPAKENPEEIFID